MKTSMHRSRSWRSVSRTQVSPNNITHLCQEIRDIKGGPKHNNRLGQINKLKKLSKHLSNTPDLDPGKHDKDGPSYAKTKYNKLRFAPPNDNPNTQRHHGSTQCPLVHHLLEHLLHCHQPILPLLQPPEPLHLHPQTLLRIPRSRPLSVRLLVLLILPLR